MRYRALSALLIIPAALVGISFFAVGNTAIAADDGKESATVEAEIAEAKAAVRKAYKAYKKYLNYGNKQRTPSNIQNIYI